MRMEKKASIGFFSLACGINPAENGNYIIDSPHDLSWGKMPIK